MDDDPIEDRPRRNIRAILEALFEEERQAFLGRCRDGRGAGRAVAYRHGRREGRLAATHHTTTVSVPRARVEAPNGEARHGAGSGKALAGAVPGLEAALARRSDAKVWTSSDG